MKYRTVAGVVEPWTLRLSGVYLQRVVLLSWQLRALKAAQEGNVGNWLLRHWTMLRVEPTLLSVLAAVVVGSLGLLGFHLFNRGKPDCPPSCSLPVPGRADLMIQ